MKVTVVWQPATEDDLADLWLNASDRAPVTQAATLSASQLKADP